MNASEVAEAVVDALGKVVPATKAAVPLHEPTLKGNEWAYVKECLDSGWISSVGRYVTLFEERIAEYTGVKHAVATSSGTAALHVALTVSGVSEDDEVLIPALTFVATANAVRYCGAIPHFVDSEERSLGIDPEKLEDYLSQVARTDREGCTNKYTGRRIKAVVVMHTFGHPSRIDELLAVCDRFNIDLLEDAAEAMGSYYRGRHVGGFGRVSAISFNGNKIVTTGGGGVMLTNDEKLAGLARHLTTTAKLPHPWEYYHDRVGYNYRMPNLNAAVGCAQLEQLPQFVLRKRKLANAYREAFSNVSGARFYTEPEYARSNYWLNAIMLDKADRVARNLILKKTNESGLLTRPSWVPLHRLPMYRTYPRMDMVQAENLESRIINLPSGAGLLPVETAADGEKRHD